MKKELYIYAKPNLPNENACPFNLLHIFCMSLFPLLSLFWGSFAFGIIIFAVYLSLSLLTYLDKDIISRYLKLAFLCVLCIYVVGIYIFEHQFAEVKFALQSFFWGLIFFVFYEISVIIKIKKRAYSNKSNNKKSSFISVALVIFLFTLIFKILNKNPNTQYLVAFFLTLLSSILLLGVFIMIQKNIIYLLVKEESGSN